MPVTTHTVIDPAEATDIESLGDTLTGAGDGTGDNPGVMLSGIETAIEKLDDWDESDRAKVNAIVGQAGVAANAGVMSATTQRVTVATNDTHMGTVGAASDANGNVHGQLRYIGEAVSGGITITSLDLDAYDPLTLALRTLPVGEALDPGLEVAPTALSAAGSTAALNVQGRVKLNWQYTVSSLDTTVVVRAEGSHDGTNWYNLDADRNNTTESSDGTYCLYCADAACKYTRFTFVSETGGTAVVVTPKLYAIK